MKSKHARYDVVNTIGKYAGAYRNEKPLPFDEAIKLASLPNDQRGRPELKLNLNATLEAAWLDSATRGMSTL